MARSPPPQYIKGRELHNTKVLLIPLILQMSVFHNSHLASKIEEIEDDSFIASHLHEITKDVLAFSLQDTPANHH